MKVLSLIYQSADFLRYLGEPALRSLALGCVAALVLAALPVRRAAVRLYVWTGVLYIALAMPLLSTLLPRVKVAIPAAGIAPMIGHELRTSESRPSRATAGESAPVLTTDKTTYSDHQAMPERGTTHNSKADPASASATMADPIVPGAISSPASTPIVSASTWKAAALAIYLTGLAILLARLFAGVWWTRRLAGSAEDISAKYFSALDDVENRRSLAALDFLRSCAHLSGIKQTPRLKQSTALAVPATVGIVSPVILLPSGWRSWTVEQLEAVLAHEVSHVARRDALTQFLALAHRAIFWFSPLSWWLKAHLSELAEQASDEAALAGGADRKRYAETLLGFFVQLESAPGRVRWQAVSMADGDGKHAERRIDRILAWKGNRSTGKSLAICLIAFAVPVIFLAASLHPFIAQAAKQDSAAAAGATTPATTATTAPTTTLARTHGSAAISGQASGRSGLSSAYSEGATEQDQKESGLAANTVNINGGTFTSDGGPRYVIMSADSKNVSMSGSDEDLQHALRLSKNIKADLIWFERDEKSYLITDPAFIARARALFAPEDELSRKQDELGRQQDELGRQQDALGEQSEKIKVTVPDITPDLERILAHLKELEAGGASQSELGHIQAQIGQLQAQIGHFQADGGRQQAGFGQQQAELGKKQAELGRQQAELGRQQAEISRHASRELRGMFDDAITKGIAKPE
jgi:beta-lactamase regulating signal transducer with metallopeptidase domain